MLLVSTSACAHTAVVSWRVRHGETGKKKAGDSYPFLRVLLHIQLFHIVAPTWATRRQNTRLLALPVCTRHVCTPHAHVKTVLSSYVQLRTAPVAYCLLILSVRANKQSTFTGEMALSSFLGQSSCCPNTYKLSGRILEALVSADVRTFRTFLLI
jgi:hypothetical protein